MSKPTTMRMTAKCSDMFGATLHDETGKQLGNYDGYVPDFFPNEHFGDYVEFTIELATGKILNWKKPTAKQLIELFG